MSLRIVIDSCQHAEQRYNTCGDYFESPVDLNDAPLTAPDKQLNIRVSPLPDRREMLLVVIHELVEWVLCQAKGISNQEIDKFDLDWCYPADFEEPGDSPKAPYYHQHQIASGIERILAAEMGVDWLTFEKHIKELYS